MGDYIQKNSQLKITLVVVGGAVNVISLQSRQLTHDVDWFKPVSLVLKARYCTGRTILLLSSHSHGIILASNWLNIKLFFLPTPSSEWSPMNCSAGTFASLC
jgi:hypothetical protein